MMSFSKSSLITVAVSALLVIDTSATGKVVGNIACLDAYSCENETLYGDTNLYCVGYYACKESNITVDNVAHCDGDYGCYDTIISGATEVRCQGAFGCAEAEIRNAGDKFYVYGVAGFSDAVIKDDGAELMKCYGFFSCLRSEVYNVSTLYVGGLYGFAYSEIDSEDIDALNVYFTGLHASYGASVYCRNGSSCELVCGSYYGCTVNTTMYCYEGSSCDYDCDDCAYDSCPTVYDENDDSSWKHIYSNVDTFDKFVAIHESMKDNERNAISAKREEFLQKNGIAGGSMFIESLRNYMRLVNPNDDGTMEMSLNVENNNNKNNRNAAVGAASLSHSHRNLIDYNSVQIAALFSVAFIVIVGIVYWRHNVKNSNTRYQQI